MKGIFSFFKSLFTSFHFIMMVLVVVLGLVVFFYGDQVVFLRDYKLEVVLVLAGLYFSYYFLLLVYLSVRKILVWRSKKKADENDEKLINYFQEVEDFLNGSLSKLKVRKKIKKFPLYLVSGASQSGKTSFSTSGSQHQKAFSLDVSLADLPTSWHLTPRGIFFECPLEVNDSASQDMLIAVFKKITTKASRFGRFCSFLVVESTETISLSDPNESEEHCKQIGTLQELLAKGSGHLYPMLLLVTRLDHLHGSQAFFDKLPEFANESAFLGEAVEPQVWGSETSKKLVGLLKSRASDFYLRVSQAPDPAYLNSQEKLAWNGFPYQLEKLSNCVGEFIYRVAAEVKGDKHPGFSGAFLVANYKDGYEQVIHAPNDKGFSKCSAPVHWSNEGGESLFLEGTHRLLACGLGYIPKPSEKSKNSNTRKGFLLGSILASISLATLSMTLADFRQHQSFMADFEESATQLVSMKSDSQVDPLVRLNKLVTFIEGYEKLLETRSYFSRVGIRVFDPSDASAEHWRNFLVPILIDELTDPLASSLVQALERRNQHWQRVNEQEKSQLRTEYYNELKSYLMMTRFSERMDSALAAKTLGKIWNESIKNTTQLSSNQNTLQDATKVLEFFYTYAFDTELANYWNGRIYSSGLVSTSRNNLAIEATADAIYQLLVGKKAGDFEAVRLSDVIPPDYPYILRNDYRFSSLYTRDVWENHVADAISDTVVRVSMDDWVLGEQAAANRPQNASAQQLENRVRELYFNDFRRHWEAYVNAFYLPEYRTLDEVYHNLKLLGSDRTPLIPLYESVAYQLGAYQPTGIGNRILPSSQRQFSRFSALEAFTDYFRVDGGSEFKDYQEGINRLAGDMETLLAGSRISSEALVYTSSMMEGTNNDQQLHAINLAVNRTRLSRETAAGELLQTLLMLPVKSTWQTLLNLSSEALQREWENQVYAQYVSEVSGRFPFQDTGEEVSLSSFKQFFDMEDGDLWRFYKEVAAPFVTLRGSSFSHNEWLGMGLRFNDDYLNAFINARQIARATFAHENGQVGFRYALMPQPTPGISESRFVLDDTPLIYRNEPQQWTDKQWTAGRQNSVARIQLRAVGQSYLISTHSEGSWSLLRLLHTAKTKRISSNEYELIWPIEDGKGGEITAHYRFRSDQAGLLLNNGLFNKYSVPRRIF